MYSHLNTVKVKHPGTALVRKMLENFELQDKDHTYPCIVHKPLGMSLAKFRSRVPKKKLPEDILKLTLIHLLIALEFLHTKANMMHCGKPQLQLYMFSTKVSKIFKRKIYSLALKTHLF
jgi:hypothetical protein